MHVVHASLFDAFLMVISCLQYAWALYEVKYMPDSGVEVPKVTLSVRDGIPLEIWHHLRTTGSFKLRKIFDAQCLTHMRIVHLSLIYSSFMLLSRTLFVAHPQQKDVASVLHR